MIEDDIVILKIGGSSITNKAQEETLDVDALDWFAKLIAASVDPSFLSSDCRAGEEEADDESNARHGSNTSKRKSKFIVVHGAGSFGHHSAKRHGLRCGKAAYLEEMDHPHHPENSAKRQKMDSSPPCEAHCPNVGALPADKVSKQRYQMEGLSKTRHSVQKLNAATVGHLINQGVNAIGISPGMSIHSLRAHGATGLPKGTAPCDYLNDGSPRGMQDLCESIKQALRAGLVPVVHGDACLMYDGLTAGILGGDTITEGIAALWDESSSLIEERKSRISRVIFITDVAGVFSSDPKSDKNAELIRSLKVDKDTGELVIDSNQGDDEKTGQGGVDALNVSGSSHAHDVTGGLKVFWFVTGQTWSCCNNSAKWSQCHNFTMWA
ncbi:hypothetical protein ACHAXR_009829 [Thalassiosira sp. AJA248-18]